MDTREVGAWLEECLEAAASKQPNLTGQETTSQNFYRNKDALSVELSSLLREAWEMKWPFVPEKWQYKQTVGSQDKTNLNDLISRHLPQLLALLKAAILAHEAHWALAVVFLVDRFLYWTDESSRLLTIAKLLHRRHPEAPAAPQLVIRQARVYLNSGKLQKAEFILSSLINNNGATGRWTYHSESDRVLVQAVSVQVRGLVLQKLGLWLEAAELIWASLVGYYALPQPDKKGIGTSLGVFANILASMNEDDFHAFKTSPGVDLSLLGDCDHRLLSAAEAAKMAVVYSQYASLYVLTNVVAQGTCLLSYSFSVACPASERRSFLLRAKAAFEIGLLTRTEGEPVTSKQELHTFIKAAYSLTVVHQWLQDSSPVALTQATQACQKALAHFYDYCQDGNQEKDGLCAGIMQLIGRVRLLLQVEALPNSDSGSFIPDSYRNSGEERPGKFSPADFSRLLGRFRKYHATLCESAEAGCATRAAGRDEAPLCVTAIGTTVATVGTGCLAESCKARGDALSGEEHPRDEALLSTTRSSEEQPGSDCLGSSWQKVSSTGSSQVSRAHGVEGVANGGWKGNGEQPKAGVGCQVESGSCRTHRKSSSLAGSDGEGFEMIEAAIETMESEEGWTGDCLDGSGQPSETGGATRSLSRLSLGTSFGSLGGSFSSQSSWEKISPVPPSLRNSPKLTSPTSQPQVRQSAAQCDSTEVTTDHSFEELEARDMGPPTSTLGGEMNPPSRRNPTCYSCPKQGTVGSRIPETQYSLTEHDYRSLLAGVCHECLLERLQSDEAKFKLKEHNRTYSAVHLKFSRATGLWTARETCAYIGEPTGMKGSQRAALWVLFLHQEERLSRCLPNAERIKGYMGKDYLKPKEIQFHLKDVERQMTAQYYVTQFNKRLYEKDVTAQLYFIPSEVLLILEAGEIVGCVTVEPYMLGDFVKLTNNTWKKNYAFQATEYGLAFGHFTYLFSGCQEVVVDLQGWVTANGKGLTYLTDPQIHSSRNPRNPSNFAERGLRYFLEEQHGPECNSVCRCLNLPPVKSHVQI